MSDTSTSMRDQLKKPSRGSADTGKSMLDSAHEMVAKALGGGSRGEWFAILSIVCNSTSELISSRCQLIGLAI